jgi:hypothetical protein
MKCMLTSQSSSAMSSAGTRVGGSPYVIWRDAESRVLRQVKQQAIAMRL